MDANQRKQIYLAAGRVEGIAEQIDYLRRGGVVSDDYAWSMLIDCLYETSRQLQEIA